LTHDATSEIEAPPAWTAPVLGRLHDLAERGVIFRCSRGACAAILCRLELDPLPAPLIENLADRQAALVWVTDEFRIAVLPDWIGHRLVYQLVVWRGCQGRVEDRLRVEALDPLRYWLGVAFPVVRAEADRAWGQEWGVN
jgi:hypothetical protein